MDVGEGEGLSLGAGLSDKAAVSRGKAFTIFY